MIDNYINNPNLGLKTVETFNGLIEYRVNCRKIKHKFYIKNVDCFLVEDKWYSMESGLIIKDYEYGTYVLKKEVLKMKKGIIKVSEAGDVETGFYTPNPLKNVQVQFFDTEGTYHNCISLDVIGCKFVENVSTGTYILLPTPSAERGCKVIRNVINHTSQTYNIEDDPNKFANAVFFHKNNDKNIQKYVKMYGRRLGNITFGMELETIRGYMPTHLMAQNGLIVCRDGSLHDSDGTQGAEFTTVPLSGEKGIQTIIDICKELKDRTVIDKQCALHLHIGNIDTSRNFMVALWNLCLNIQDDVFKMFPFSKINEVEYAGKNKNYCKKLPSLMRFNPRIDKAVSYREYIDIYYNRIFNFLSEGRPASKEFNRRNKHHPKKHKWERNGRYFWVNFMNLIFSNRNTIEFRIHQGTKNPQKIITWLFICNAMLMFTKRHMCDLIRGKKFTFKDVLDYYNPPKETRNYDKSLSFYLVSYYEHMRNSFYKMKLEGDYMGVKDTQEDHFFKFNNGVSKFIKMFTDGEEL